MEQPIVDPSKVSVLVAGALGAFLSMLFQRSTSKLQIFTTLVTAEVVSYYFANPIWSLAHDKISWVDDQWHGPVALTIGLLAIFVVGGVTKMFTDFWGSPWQTMGAIVSATLERFLPGKRGK